MKLSQEIMDAFVVGATDNGMKNWSERDDMKGLQGVLDLLSPAPADPEKTARRTSRELTQIRTLHSNAFNSRARIIGAAATDDFDPEAHLMVQALETVEEILRPWQREA